MQPSQMHNQLGGQNLYLGPLVSTFNKIIESQRKTPRNIVHVPNVELFLRQNFFIDPSNISNHIQPPVPSPIIKSALKYNIEKQIEHKQTLSAMEKDLAMDLATMGSSLKNSKTNISTPSPAKQLQNNIKNKVVKSKESEWIKKRLKLDKEKLATIKKTTPENKFSKVGVVPLLSLSEAAIPYLQVFVKEIRKKQKNKFAEKFLSVEDEEMIENDENDENEDEITEIEKEITENDNNVDKNEDDTDMTDTDKEIKIEKINQNDRDQIIINNEEEMNDNETNNSDKDSSVERENINENENEIEKEKEETKENDKESSIEKEDNSEK